MNQTFALITDSSSNVSEEELKEYDIKMLSYTIIVDGEEKPCYTEGMDLDERSGQLYDYMKSGGNAKTSLVNGESFKEFVLPFLNEGKDVLFLSLSSGVSGTYNAVNNACRELAEAFPERKIYCVDTHAAGLGEGLLVLRAGELRKEGKSIDEVYSAIEEEKKNVRQVFMVDDLGYLQRGGRISRLTAAIGSILHIKPILKGENGKIVMFDKARGVRRALDTLVKDFAEKAKNFSNKVIAVTYFGVKEQAEYLISKLRDECHYMGEIIVRAWDICTSVYVGPGAVALFFVGDNA